MNYISITSSNSSRDGCRIKYRPSNMKYFNGKFACVQISRASAVEPTTPIGQLHTLGLTSNDASNPTTLCKTFHWDSIYNGAQVFYKINPEQSDWVFEFKDDSQGGGMPVEVNDDYLIEVIIKDHI